MKAVQKEVEKMNTDKIYAEAIANQYSVKTATKVTALKKLDKKVKPAPTKYRALNLNNKMFRQQLSVLYHVSRI